MTKKRKPTQAAKVRRAKRESYALLLTPLRSTSRPGFELHALMTAAPRKYGLDVVRVELIPVGAPLTTACIGGPFSLAAKIGDNGDDDDHAA